MHSRVERVVLTRRKVPSNHEQSRMFRFGSLDVDTPRCHILFGFLDTGGGVQLFSSTSAAKSSMVLHRPSWAAPYLLYCLGCALFEACLTWIVEPLFLLMVVVSFGNCRLCGLACRSCSNVGFLHCHDDSINHLCAPECTHVILFRASRWNRDSLVRVWTKALELHRSCRGADVGCRHGIGRKHH